MPTVKENKLRIAMLGHKRIPSREGGIEIVVGELAKRMASQGHEVICYNRKGHHVSGAAYDEVAKNEYFGVKLKNVWTLDKKGLAAMTASFSAALCAAFGNYDVVHFHAEGPCAAMWIPKLFGKKCVATIHGLDHQRAKWGRFASWYIRTGEKIAVRFADHIIVLSAGVQQYFRDTYHRDTILVPNGIDRHVPREADLITKRFGVKKDEYLLFLGRLVPEKGAQYLIEAFQSVQTDKKLVIAGGSSDSSEFERELRNLAADDPRIIFTGFLQGQVMEELYSNAYLYALPSDLEGMPISLLEAMSFGNCCLTSDISECTDVIGEYGISFKKADVADLKDKLQYLCDNPHTVARLQEQSADYICGRYSWKDVTNKTLQLYGVQDLEIPTSSTEKQEYESSVHQ